MTHTIWDELESKLAHFKGWPVHKVTGSDCDWKQIYAEVKKWQQERPKVGRGWEATTSNNKGGVVKNDRVISPDGCTLRTYYHFMMWVRYVEKELEERRQLRAAWEGGAASE